MPNRGVAPFDPNTPVGQFRALAPDVSFVALDPAEDGYGDYRRWSDDEIAVFLGYGNGSIARAVGYALMQSANVAAEQAKSVKDYDLQVDLTKRSSELRAQAQAWFAQAANADTTAGTDDIFEVVDTGPNEDALAHIQPHPTEWFRGW